ncbi:MAG: hypothetical protein AAGF85_21615 [Bacteroidota bacterium]
MAKILLVLPNLVCKRYFLLAGMVYNIISNANKRETINPKCKAFNFWKGANSRTRLATIIQMTRPANTPATTPSDNVNRRVPAENAAKATPSANLG